jgi:hypothetical protein
MKTCSLFCLLLIASVTSIAQQTPVTFTLEANKDSSSYKIFVNNTSNIKYTAIIHFDQLLGYTINFQNGAPLTAAPGKKQIGILKKNKVAVFESYKYSTHAYKGVLFDKAPANTATYLLPAALNKTVGTFSVQFKSGDDIHLTGFSYKPGDTIFAARAGKVMLIDETTDDKVIEVEQKDETIARYTLLADGLIAVHAGDDIWPGKPLASFTKNSDANMAFSVYYLDKNKLDSTGAPLHDDGTQFKTYSSLTPSFITKESTTPQPVEADKTYTVIKTDDVVGAELTKKEKKAIGIK